MPSRHLPSVWLAVATVAVCCRAQAQSSSNQSEPIADKPQEVQHLVGLRFRTVVIPRSVFTAIGLDGGRTVFVPSFGPEYAVRREHFEYNAWLALASYAMADTPFKAKAQADAAYESVRSDLKTLSLGADVWWSAGIGRNLELLSGGGLGLGVVFGDIYLNQLYPPSRLPSNPVTYQRCVGPNNPSVGGYCGTEDAHYNDFKEPSMFNGGQKPVLIPWIAIQSGVRWKVHRSVTLRFEAGLSLPGPFFFGLAGQHALF